MAKKSEFVVDAAAPASPALAYVLLLADWRDHKAGKVLAADFDLLAAAEIEGARHRAASDLERRLGGFVD